MPILDIDGARINYVQLSTGSDEPREDLVMIHGLGTSLAFWFSPHGLAFAERYRVTLIDLRGHGRSSMPASGYHPQRLACDVQAVLDTLGIEKAHFVAHSFGGVIALCLAGMNPSRFTDLVLADALLSARRHTRRTWAFGKTIQRLLDENGIDVKVTDPFFGYHILEALARLDEKSNGLSPELAGLLGPVAGKGARGSGRQWLELLSTTSAREEFMADDGLTEERLRELSFPVLAIYGAHSNALHCGEWLRRTWTHASFVVIPGAGHFFPASRPGIFMDACNRFWGESAPGADSAPPANRIGGTGAMWKGRTEVTER